MLCFVFFALVFSCCHPAGAQSTDAKAAQPSSLDLQLTEHDVLEAYKPKLAAMLSKNPWGVPISLGTWGGSGGVTRFATEMYLLHEAFPASIGPQYTLDGLDYVLGRHPVSNVSYVSSVGTQSKLIAYGNNRADYTFVPGGIIPGSSSFNRTSRN